MHIKTPQNNIAGGFYGSDGANERAKRVSGACCLRGRPSRRGSRREQPITPAFHMAAAIAGDSGSGLWLHDGSQCNQSVAVFLVHVLDIGYIKEGGILFVAGLVVHQSTPLYEPSSSKTCFEEA